MNTSRRSFMRLLGSSLFVPVAEPVVKYFLPPKGGWQLKGRHYEYIIADDLVHDAIGLETPLEFLTYYEFVMRSINFISGANDIESVRQNYLNMRAKR